MRTRTIAIANQKGGTGKSTTAASLGIALSMRGKRVLLVDADPQGDLTTSLGWDPDRLETTLSTHLEKSMLDEPFPPLEGVLRHKEGVDLMPANIDLSAADMALVNAMSREHALKTWLDEAKRGYDYVLIDCPPSLGMMTVNALTAADGVLIPVQAQFLPAKGMTQLIKTIGRVRRRINPSLAIEGVLITLVDARTNLARRGEHPSRIRRGDQGLRVDRPHGDPRRGGTRIRRERVFRRPLGKGRRSVRGARKGGDCRCPARERYPSICRL